MLKTKLKLFVIVLLSAICLFSSLSFATDAVPTDADVNAVDATADNTTAADNSGSGSVNQLTSDIYVKQNSYTFSDNLFGNVYVLAGDFTMDPKSDSNRGIIQGDLFALANTVTLKSNLTYGTTNDEQGNLQPESALGLSKVAGNTFIAANKVVIESGCIISGDLFITANEVEIQPYAQIYGNVYVVANKFISNGGIYLNLYATVSDFKMTSYQSFVGVDAHICAKNVVMNGVVGNNTFIQSEKLYTGEFFVNYAKFNAVSNSAILLGDFKGDSKVDTKNLSVIANKDELDNNSKTLNKTPLAYLLNKDDKGNYTANDFSTTFEGKLSYTAKSEIKFADGVAPGAQFTKYSMTKDFLNILLYGVLALLTILVYVMLIYFLSKKFKYNCFENKLYDVKRALISLGVGVGLAIAVPFVCLALTIIIVGIPLAGLLAALYGILVALAIPAVVIQSAVFLNEKLLKGKLNHYLAVLCMAVIFWLLLLIPYAGCVIAALALIVGSGNLAVGMCTKKECCKKE